MHHSWFESSAFRGFSPQGIGRDRWFKVIIISDSWAPLYLMYRRFCWLAESSPKTTKNSTDTSTVSPIFWTKGNCPWWIAGWQSSDEDGRGKGWGLRMLSFLPKGCIVIGAFFELDNRPLEMARTPHLYTTALIILSRLVWHERASLDAYKIKRSRYGNILWLLWSTSIRNAMGEVQEAF